MNLIYFYPYLRFDKLSIVIALACLFFSLIVGVYSYKFLKGKVNLVNFFFFYCLSALSSCLAVLANNLVLLLVFWGILGFTLYMLIVIQGSAASNAAAKKALIIVGGSDSLMILGAVVIFYLTGTAQMDRIQIPLTCVYWFLPVLAYLCLAVACFTKAGIMPFHTWIPDCAQDANVSVSAFLPASLDKLLGIYLLIRISLDLFLMSNAMNAFLMLIGAFTIIAGVMMALVQHDMKRLFGYHAVSQVGYMVLGLGTANPIGIAGGLFHMFNNTLYKTCLFLTSGNVEYRTGTTDLDELGGLSRHMRITYIGALIASLAISGVPPFNGFFSKWMIYQGVIESFSRYKFIALICLVSAMFGSGLTLASFLKVLHAAFLGQEPAQKRGALKEVPWPLALPVIILSALCIIFGIFAFALPLKYLVYPALGITPAEVNFGPASIYIFAALVIGLSCYYLSRLKMSSRENQAFIGGEVVSVENKVSGTDFYNTIREFGILKVIYAKAEAGIFDIYIQGKKIIFSLSGAFGYLHNGILSSYMIWCLLGMIAIFLYLFH